MDKVAFSLWRILGEPIQDEEGLWWLPCRVTDDEEDTPFDVRLYLPSIDDAYELMLRFEVATQPDVRGLVNDNYKDEMH